MKLLHITDLHYTEKPGSRTKQKKFLTDFFHDLKSVALGTDLVVFSGDMVQNGGRGVEFNHALEDFVNPLIQVLGIEKDQFFICPGNHDVNRKHHSKSIIKYVDEIKDSEELEDFFNPENKDFINSMELFDNYEKFMVENFRREHKEDKHRDLYSTYVRKVGDQIIGIACLNNAWRSVGSEDEGNLVFPISRINKVADDFMKCDFKILNLHHPLSWHRRYNAYELEDATSKYFDLVLTGHVHKPNLTLDLTYSTGSIKLTSPAALSFDETSQLGYTVFDYNPEESTFQTSTRLYDSSNNVFYDKEPFEGFPRRFNIPTTKEKEEQIEMRGFIRDKLTEELEKSSDYFVENEGTSDRNILDLSTVPVLKDKSLQELINDKQQNCPDFKWEKFFLLDKDYLIQGQDKCGKTILLKKLEVESLEQYSNLDCFPLFLDLKESADKRFNIVAELRKQYGIKKKKAERICKVKRVLLLIDNYHVDNKPVIDCIINFLNEHSRTRIIACSNEGVLVNPDHSNIIGRSFEKLYFHRLRKKHIRELTKKGFSLPKNKEEQIVDKIIAIFKRLSIPYSYWTVSVFLWIFNKSPESSISNEVDLIDLYIDRLIGREELTINAARFNYKNYKKLLAHLAHFLLKKYHKQLHYAPYKDIIAFFDSYLESNPRFNASAREVFDYLDERNILRVKEGDKYSFRLNGVFEYFIAYYMYLNESFLQNVVDDNEYYLSFANEFELYAGFRRNDKAFLISVYQRTRKKFQHLDEYYDLEQTTVDKLLESHMNMAKKATELVEKFTEKIKDGLSEVQQDVIEEQLSRELEVYNENNEVKQKQKRDITSFEELEEYIGLLGKSL